MTLRTLNYGNYGIFLIMGSAGFCPSSSRNDKRNPISDYLDTSDFATWPRKTRNPSTLNLPGLLSNQGEKGINLYFMMVPLRKKY